MKLHGQGGRRANEAGYAMAALLVSIAVMSILLSAAMPVWKQQGQREKEEELIFRGEQYARAIGLFQRKYAGAFPPNVDVLVEQRFLRRRYKDPVTKEDFEILYQNTAELRVPGAAGSPGQRGGSSGESASRARSRTGSPAPSSSRTAGGTIGAAGGVIGVASKSEDRAIRVYNGRQHYNEWQFVYTPVTTQPGGSPGETARPGQAPGGGQTRPGTTPGPTQPAPRPGQPPGRGDPIYTLPPGRPPGRPPG